VIDFLFFRRNWAIWRKNGGEIQTYALRRVGLFSTNKENIPWFDTSNSLDGFNHLT